VMRLGFDFVDGFRAPSTENPQNDPKAKDHRNDGFGSKKHRQRIIPAKKSNPTNNSMTSTSVLDGALSANYIIGLER
jgi:hypothetical protein